MYISRNTSGMPAEVSTWSNAAGRMHAVLVIKGTFEVAPDGTARLADEQRPLVFTDAPHGEPGASSIRYECDFAPEKPRADLLVLADGYAPGGRPAKEFLVGVRLGRWTKRLRVSGPRCWLPGVFGVRASEPRPILKLPLTFEHAFGGSDHSHPDPKHHGSELRNPVGTGLVTNPKESAVEGVRLPEVEHLDDILGKPRDRPKPAGFGVVSRAWQPRLRHAGTYDARWVSDGFPFLPKDFTTAHFQAAPEDQQLPSIEPGALFEATHLTADGRFRFTVPAVAVPVAMRFDDRETEALPRPDTLLVEPAEGRFLLTWRVCVPLGRKLIALREILIGPRPRVRRARTRNGKPYFRSLGALVAWRRGKAPPPDEGGDT